jgi:hypothetical protein
MRFLYLCFYLLTSLSRKGGLLNVFKEGFESGRKPVSNDGNSDTATSYNLLIPSQQILYS